MTLNPTFLENDDAASVLDHRVEPHDVNQLELKLAYLIRPGVRQVRYLVEAFLFIPRTLGVAKSNYRAEQFYGDTSAFLRFKTPTVELEELAAGEGSTERFKTLESLMSAGEGAREDALVRNLKILGCIYRTALRDSTPPILRALEALEGQGTGAVMPPELAETLLAWTLRVDAAVGQLTAMGERLKEKVPSPVVRDAWGSVDEYIALLAEDVSTDLVEKLDSLLLQGSADLRRKLADMAVRYYRYRVERAYPSYVVEGTSNEELPYRRRILKRIVSSVLYLDVRHEQAGRWARDMIGMAAAAVAMLFAILVAIWAQVEWDMLSGPFVAIMVASYMIKDRIKEWGKAYLGRRFVRYTPDKVMRIIDPQGGVGLGTCRESVRTLVPAKVEDDILAVRHNHDSRVAEDGRPETVIHYAKEVMLYPDKLQRGTGDFEGLNDIIRFNFAHLRRRMDKPVEAYRHVHPRTREIISVPCSRVYHVNLILRFRALDSEEEQLERVRIVLDQQGIKRVESPSS
jgi:hypothetical protein